MAPVPPRFAVHNAVLQYSCVVTCTCGTLSVVVKAVGVEELVQKVADELDAHRQRVA